MLVCALELLRCPDCGCQEPLKLRPGGRRQGEDIASGRAGCPGCGKDFPIEDGVLDLAGPQLPRPKLAQRLMEWLPVVGIYEESWRPALVRRVQGSLSFEEEYRLVARLLRAGPGERLADLACGPGNYTRRWARLVASEAGTGRQPSRPEGLVLGLDRSGPMLAEAVRKAKDEGVANVSFIRAEAHRLPLAAGAFDGASCCAALHLFSNPGAVIGALSRALKPGGRFACLTVRADGREWLRWLQQGSEIVSGLHFFDDEELPRLCQQAGLEWLAEERLDPIWIFGARREQTGSAQRLGAA